MQIAGARGGRESVGRWPVLLNSCQLAILDGRVALAALVGLGLFLITGPPPTAPQLRPGGAALSSLTQSSLKASAYPVAAAPVAVVPLGAPVYRDVPVVDTLAVRHAAADVAGPVVPVPTTSVAPSPAKKGRKKRYKRRAPVPWNQKERPLLAEFPGVKKSLEFVRHLEALPNFKTAVEVGAGNGMLAKMTLDWWASCTEYHLVDAWEGEQDPALKQARWRMRDRQEVTHFVIAPTSVAATQLPDAHFDYIYLKGRHDYCGAAGELASWWPKLRPGGIIGGNNYIDAEFARKKLKQEEDWSRCEDGSVQPEAVKGAVDDFSRSMGGLRVYTSNEFLPSWYIQKPY